MKGNITISLDTEIIAELRSRGLKPSSILNSYLRVFLDLPEAEERYDIDKLHKEIEQGQAEVIRKQEQLKNIQNKIKSGEVIIC